MNSENDDNDDNECWDVINGIIDNADYIYKMCEKTVWFWRGSGFKLSECWGDAVDCDCDEMFWDVSGANWRKSELKKDNCDIC